MSKKKVVKKQEYVVLVPLSQESDDTRGGRYSGLYNYQIRGGIFTSIAAAKREAETWTAPLIALVRESLDDEQRGIIEQQEPSR